MPTTFATFERLKDKGVAAFKAGDYAGARPYLIQAAECIIELAESAATPNVRRQHEAVAAEMIDLARSCEKMQPRAATGGRRDRNREGDDEGADAADWVVKEKPGIRFDDIAGLEDVKQEIRLKMIYPFQHPELAQQYGVPVGGGLLLYGPPGTGKTMIAKAIAAEVEATMFVISPAQIMSKWVGEAEQNVKKLFEAAKGEPRAIIFMDEVEALAPRRRDSGSTVMTRLVPQILQELEGFDRAAARALLFVGATNEPWSLDPAILRPGRFDAKVYVPLPDGPARHKLLEIHLGKRPVETDVDFAALVELLAGYSGADIKAVCDRAAAIPFMESVGGAPPRPIKLDDVRKVIADTPPSVKQGDLTKFERYAEEN